MMSSSIIHELRGGVARVRPSVTLVAGMTFRGGVRQAHCVERACAGTGAFTRIAKLPSDRREQRGAPAHRPQAALLQSLR